MTMPSVLYNNLPPAANTQLAPSSSSSDTSNNTLGPNSFITLLTAQLQAQDPLNPMDPSQMVDQLTQINSLQQLIQIQGDLQTIVGGSSATSGATGSTASGSGGTNGTSGS